MESSSEDQPTSSFVTEPGENAEASTSSFPPNSKKKKRKRKRRVKKEAVMNQLVAVRQQSKSSLDNKGQNLSLWDTSAQTLLNMTLTFLRHVPEVINRICFLILEAIINQLSFLLFQRVISHPSNREVISRLLDLTSPETLASFRSRTIHWSSLLALHLLHLCPVKLTPRLPFSAIGNPPSSSSSSPSKRSSPVRRFTGKKKKKKQQQSTSSRKHLFF